MKALITGSKGYIAQNLIEALKQQHIKIVEYDIADGHDILNLDDLRKHMTGCDYVYNLAAISGVQACEEHKHSALEINALAPKALVDTAHEHGAKPILISSFAVKAPRETRSYYGQTKAVMEEYCMHESVILRLSNVYGGNNYLTMKPTNLIAHLAKDDPIMLFNGRQTRDFVHMNTVIEWLLKAMTLPYGVYDVCSGQETSLETLARIVGIVRGVPVVKIKNVEDI